MTGRDTPAEPVDSPRARDYTVFMTRARRILDEVRRLPTEQRMDVLQGLVDLVAPPLSAEQEQGVIDALDEADRGEVVDATLAFAKQRQGLRDKG
jgi:hypothetical protein